MSAPAAGAAPRSRTRSGLDPAPAPAPVRPIGADTLVALLEAGLEQVVLVDCRPFVDYNTSHILEAVNVNCSKLMKRRLQQDKVQISELLQHAGRRKLDLRAAQDVVVYDQDSDLERLGPDSFLGLVLLKLGRSFGAVRLLSGGFQGFSRLFPGLCEGKSFLVPPCLSQPCLPVGGAGPTRILPHLYLGCQRDVLNQDLMQQNRIGYVLNASNTCPKPDFIAESHFLRVPVNDSFCEKILPWLDRSVDFIELAKASDGRVLVHCLAGISRSATIAIAYIMKRMEMSLDEAYRFVKEKRPTISPNFNFLGQLLDFEKRIRSAKAKLQNREVPVLPDGPGPAPRPGCSREPPPDEGVLDRALSGLHFPVGCEQSARLKRSFSLDIKSSGDGDPPGPALPDAGDPFGAVGWKEAGSKGCPFSPVEEAWEQPSPDPGEAAEAGAAPPPPPAPACRQPLQRSAAGYLSGLSLSQQHLSKPGPCAGAALKGWHSDLLLGPVGVSTSTLAAGWYLSDSTHLLPASLPPPYGCGPGLEAAVRRRGGPRAGDRGASRRSWHEESSFEKQLKRRSCQMESGGGARAASGSGSLELIRVS